MSVANLIFAEYVARAPNGAECVWCKESWKDHRSCKQQAAAPSEKTVAHDRQDVTLETKETKKTKWYKRVSHFFKEVQRAKYCFPEPSNLN